VIGRVVGQYKLLEKIGEGGMGSVYKAVDLMIDRPVAVKMVRRDLDGDSGAVERFRSEATLLARLSHPSIATLYAFCREADGFFMVMELVEGTTLASRIKDSGRLAPDQAIPIFCQILEAIEYAHETGVLHRDIKPANILLTRSGVVKVTDFGIARAVGAPRQTRVGALVGTLEYLAPECIRGHEPGTRSDVYSLGIVLYEMLSGRVPFERDTDYELMQAHIEVEPPALGEIVGDIPPRLERVVMRALAKDPAQRFASVAEFRAAIASNAEEPATTERRSAHALPATRLADVTELPATRFAALEASVHPHALSRWTRVVSRIGVARIATAGAFLSLAIAGVLWFTVGSSRTPQSKPAASAVQPAPVALPATAVPEPVSPAANPAMVPTDEPVRSAVEPPKRRSAARSPAGRDSEANRTRRRSAALEALDH
jgi:serine/threonine-protein kinase